MNKYIMALLGVIILVLSSYLYKESRERILADFPMPAPEEGVTGPQDVPVIHLFLFFNSENCRDCLSVVDVLNELPSYFRVMGLVPQRDFKNHKRIRDITRAKFDLRCYDPFKRYLPHYAPTLFGINKNGKVLFVLPAVPGESSYLPVFLDGFYRRAYQLLLDKGYWED